MSKLTITEALAEIKTINKRIEKKRAFIQNHIYRQEALKDPFQKDGGSMTLIEREMQAIGDLEERKVILRWAIQQANQANSIEIKGIKRTIADWLVWTREVAPQRQLFLQQISNSLSHVRQEAMRRGVTVVQVESVNPQDIVVNINEQNLALEIEELEEILGSLDGQLSLKNATTFVEL